MIFLFAHGFFCSLDVFPPCLLALQELHSASQNVASNISLLINLLQLFLELFRIILHVFTTTKNVLILALWTSNFLIFFTRNRTVILTISNCGCIFLNSLIFFGFIVDSIIFLAIKIIARTHNFTCKWLTCVVKFIGKSICYLYLSYFCLQF